MLKRGWSLVDTKAIVQDAYVATYARAFTNTNLEAGWALNMLMALPLLPANKIVFGLAVIQQYVQDHGLANAFQILLRYIDQTWIQSVGVAHFSVFRQSHRTNNALESFYSHLVKVMGTHPSFWHFHHHPYWHRYRTTPTQYKELLPVQAIVVQAEELAEALNFGPAEEVSVEAGEGQPVCFICMANKPTRMAIPCGHNIVCRECLPHFIHQVGYHRVITPGGQVVDTNFRLPITCPNCRAIVGQVIPTYL